MSALDPTPELDQVITRVLTDDLPTMAADWAKAASDVAEGLRSRTSTVEEAAMLERFYQEACSWLQVPSIL